MLFEKFPDNQWVLSLTLPHPLPLRSVRVGVDCSYHSHWQTNKQSIKIHTQNSDILTFHNPHLQIVLCTTLVTTCFILFNEEAGDGFIVLINGPVKQRLLTFPRTLRPQIYITTMLYLHGQGTPRLLDDIFSIHLECLYNRVKIHNIHKTYIFHFISL